MSSSGDGSSSSHLRNQFGLSSLILAAVIVTAAAVQRMVYRNEDSIHTGEVSIRNKENNNYKGFLHFVIRPKRKQTCVVYTSFSEFPTFLWKIQRIPLGI